MKNIKASDLEIIKVKKIKNKKWKPKFLGMKKKDIFKIEYVAVEGFEEFILGRDNDGNEVYSENSYGNWWKKDGKDIIRFVKGTYYLNKKEAVLKTKK